MASPLPENIVGYTTHGINETLRTPQLRDKHRRLAIELVDSEIIYVDFLRTLHDTFYIRLKGMAAFEKPIISHNQIKTVFMNLEGIYAMSQRLRDDLVKLRYEGIKHVVDGVGGVMKKYIPFMRLYIDYVGRFPQSMKLLESLEKDKKWKEFRELGEWCCKRELQSLMIMPIQRMPRYVMFLKELHNSASSKSSEDIRGVSERLQAVAWHINAQSQRMQARKMVVDLQEEIFADQYRLVNPTRYFILQGDLKKVHNRGANILRRTESYLFILFNDILIYSSRTGFESKHAKFRHALPLDKIKIIEDGDQPKNKLKPGEIGFYIETLETSAAKSFLVLAPDEDKRKEWIAKIREAAVAHCKDINSLGREPQTVEQIESEIMMNSKEGRAHEHSHSASHGGGGHGARSPLSSSTEPSPHSRKGAAFFPSQSPGGKRGSASLSSNAPSNAPRLSESESNMETTPEERHLTQINSTHYPTSGKGIVASHLSTSGVASGVPSGVKTDQNGVPLAVRLSPRKAREGEPDHPREMPPPFLRSASEPPFAILEKEGGSGGGMGIGSGGGRASPATPHIEKRDRAQLERECGRKLKVRSFDTRAPLQHVHKPKSLPPGSRGNGSGAPHHKRERSADHVRDRSRERRDRSRDRRDRSRDRRDRSRDQARPSGKVRSRRFNSDASHASVSGAGALPAPSPSPKFRANHRGSFEGGEHHMSLVKQMGAPHLARHQSQEVYSSSARLQARKSWSVASSVHTRNPSAEGMPPSARRAKNRPQTPSGSNKQLPRSPSFNLQLPPGSGSQSRGGGLAPATPSRNMNRRVTSTSGVKTSGARTPIARATSDSRGSTASTDSEGFPSNTDRSKSSALKQPFSALVMGVSGALGGDSTGEGGLSTRSTRRRNEQRRSSNSHSKSASDRTGKIRTSSIGSVEGADIHSLTPTPAVTPRATGSVSPYHSGSGGGGSTPKTADRSRASASEPRSRVSQSQPRPMASSGGSGGAVSAQARARRLSRSSALASEWHKETDEGQGYRPKPLLRPQPRLSNKGLPASRAGSPPPSH